MSNEEQTEPLRLTFEGVEYDCTPVKLPEPKPDPRLHWEGEKDKDGDRLLLDKGSEEGTAFVSVNGEGAYCTPPMLYASALAQVRIAMALEGLPESVEDGSNPGSLDPNKRSATFNLRCIVEANK